MRNEVAGKNWMLVFAGLVALVLIPPALLGTTACSGEQEGFCEFDYNCDEGHFCVTRKCQKGLPPANDAGTDAGGTPDTGKPDMGRPDVAKPDNAPPDKNGGTCTKPGECFNDEHCRAGRCVFGYIDASFSHQIIDPNAPAKKCASNSQCSSWQTCYNGTCMAKYGRSSKATGKSGTTGVACTEASYSELVSDPGGNFVRSIILTSLTVKTMRQVEIDVPVAALKKGVPLTEKDGVKGRVVNLLVEYDPPVRQVLGVMASGTAQFANVGSALGSPIAGSAKFTLRAP